MAQGREHAFQEGLSSLPAKKSVIIMLCTPVSTTLYGQVFGGVMLGSLILQWPNWGLALDWHSQHVQEYGKTLKRSEKFSKMLQAWLCTRILPFPVPQGGIPLTPGAPGSAWPAPSPTERRGVWVQVRALSSAWSEKEVTLTIFNAIWPPMH